MTQLVYIPIALILILFQTAILPFFFHVNHSYDLMIIFIIYLGLYRSLLEGIPILLILGLMMDCLSGGAFGTYTSTYMWFYVIIRMTIQYLHVNSLIVLPVTLISGVILENLIVLLTVIIGRGELDFSYTPFKIVLYQLLWAVLTGPIVFEVIKTIHESVERWSKMNMGRDKKQSDFKY